MEICGSCWSALCPTTQTGAVRIVSHPRYSNAQASPAVVMASLASFCSVGGHTFVADDVSLLTALTVRRDKLLSSAQVTDTYLVGLASRLGASLATFARRLSASAVADGNRHVVHIP